MTPQYLLYLNSPEWKRKRWKRLAQSFFRCEACDSKDRVEVHHLTYERIFNEDMADLLPLCSIHHDAATELQKDGTLPRTGNVFKLARMTLKAIAPESQLPEKFRYNRLPKPWANMTLMGIRDAMAQRDEARLRNGMRLINKGLQGKQNE